MPLNCIPVEVTDELRSRLGPVERLIGLIDLVSKEKIIMLSEFWHDVGPIEVGDVSVIFGIRRDPDTGHIDIRIDEYTYYSKTRRVLTISYPMSGGRDRSIRMEVCAEGVERGAEKHAIELLAHLDKAGWRFVKNVIEFGDWLELFQISEYIQSRFEKGVGGAPGLIKELINKYGELVGEYILRAPDPHRFIVMAYAVDALPLIKKFVEQRYGSVDLDKIAPSGRPFEPFLHSVFLALSAVSDNAEKVARRLLKALPEDVSILYPWRLLSIDKIAETILDAAGILSASVKQLGELRALKQAINSMYLASSGGEPEPLRLVKLDTSWLWEARKFPKRGSLIDVAREVLARLNRVDIQPGIVMQPNILEYAVTESHTSGHVFNKEAKRGLRGLLRAVST